MWIKKTPEEMGKTKKEITKKSLWSIVTNMFLLLFWSHDEPEGDSYVCLSCDTDAVSYETYEECSGICPCGEPYHHIDTVRWVGEK